jgi:hypothetical protein
VELDAAAQLEFPGERIDGLPGFGQSRNRPLALIAKYQIVEDVRRDVVVRRHIVIVRIDRGDVGPDADGQIGRGGG